ncbi:hypothetical protein GCM10027072_25740 [Streptomyces bullii]
MPLVARDPAHVRCFGGGPGVLVDARLEDRQLHGDALQGRHRLHFRQEPWLRRPYPQLLVELAEQRLQRLLALVRLATRKIEDLGSRLLAHDQQTPLPHDHRRHDDQRFTAVTPARSGADPTVVCHTGHCHDVRRRTA